MFHPKEPYCNVGDTLYVCNKDGVIKGVKATKVEKTEYGHYVYRANNRTYFDFHFGDCIFTSLVECKRVYNRKFRIKEKNRLLKEYEIQLNKMLGLENHFTIKVK